MKKVVVSIIIFLLILSGMFLFCNKKIKYNVLVLHDINVNEEIDIKSFLKCKNCQIVNKNVIFDKIGKNNLTITIKNIFKQTINKKIYVNVVDTDPPIIEGVKNITIYQHENPSFYDSVVANDNSNEKINLKVIGTYDTNKAGEYDLEYEAKDSSGNVTKIPFKLIVKAKQVININSNSKYYIKVNRKLNVVMIYEKVNNNYTLIKTMLCSTGDGTPIGIYKTSDRYEILSLVGNVWGHYTMRITGPIFFHSVPYYSKPNPYWNDLESEEYNKLGSKASLGCIRLAVIDAKWIYDNILFATPVEIYDSDFLPDGVQKPEGIKIDLNNPNKGWDPTDPDENNPWKKDN